MLRAYLDESSDSKKKLAYAVAGLVANESEWLKFEMLWQDATYCLRETFHMSECECFQGQFEDWTPPDKAELIKLLTKAVTVPRLEGFGSSVDVEIFRSIFPNEPNDALYFLCFRHCVSMMAYWGAQENQRVAFVFDQNEQFEHRAHQWFNRIKSTRSAYQRGFGSLAFEDRRLFQPLQAADLIAYETYKAAHHAAYEPNRKMRKSVASVIRGQQFRVRYFERDVLQALRSEMEKAGKTSLMEYMLKTEVINYVPEQRT